MRYIFWVFLLISFLLHLFLLDVLHLPQGEKKREKPVDIQIIPKEKPKEKTGQPEPSPKRYVPPTHLDEQKETHIEEDRPSPPKQQKKAAVKNGEDRKKSPDRTPAQKPSAAEEKPASQPPTALPPKSTADMPKVSPDTPKQSIPSTADRDAERKRIDSIMNPKDVIEKYATGGSEVTGEDTVSMQYVKMRYQSYFYKFASRLYRVWTYPPEAAMRGEGGIVQASFIVSRDGSISSIRIIRSSGYPDLDNEVITALKKMSGVPLPESYNLDNLKVDAFFHYINGNRFRVY